MMRGVLMCLTECMGDDEMGIDYIVDYDCEPKRALTVPGLLGRLKGRDRANAVIQLYRSQGDTRSPSKMGFEMVRRTPDGGEETEVVIVQDMLDEAEVLTSWESYCKGCPANAAGTPFGCIGTINYPISAAAERWLLEHLPTGDHPLPYIVLQRTIRQMGYSGDAASPLRSQAGVFMEAETPLDRNLEALRVNGDQVFEMLFLSGPIQPAHGAMLLQLFGAISQDLDADVMMQLANPPSPEWVEEHAPFLLLHGRGDESVRSLTAFFYALYTACRLNVAVLLDV